MNPLTSASWLWDSVWQGTLLLGLGGLLSLWANRQPARAHRILVLAVAGCLLTPLLSQGVRWLGWGMFGQAPAVDLSADTVRVSHSAPAVVVASQPVSSSRAGLPSVSLPESARSGPMGTLREVGAPASKLRWLGLLGVGWLALSLVAVARLLILGVRQMLVLHRARPLEDRVLLGRLEVAARTMNLEVQPRVRVSDRVASPVICCWGCSPIVVVPQVMPQLSEPEVWTAILCHELAHWKRRDHYAAMLGELLACWLPWHPLVWWARRRLEQLSELACDRWVIACGQPAEAYADSLLDLVPQRKSALVLPAVGAKTHLEGRIRCILSDHRPAASVNGRWAWSMAIATLVLVGALSLAQHRSLAADGGWQLSKKGIPGSESGLGLRLLAKGWASDFSGCPSADGRYVCDLNREEAAWELCVRDRLSGKRRPLTRDSGKAGGGPFVGVISPDNKHVAYNWFRTNTGVADELRLVRLDGSGTRVLYRDASAGLVPVQWSSDGTRLLATATKDGTRKVLLISVPEGAAEIVTVLPVGPASASGHAGLSPDGRYVAYSIPQRGDTNLCDVFLSDTREKREIPLVTHPADDCFLGWSLDGKWIAFASDRSGTADLWIVRVGGERTLDAPRLIKADIGVIKPKGFTRDGSFYYAREFRSGDVYTAALDVEQGRLLEPPVPLPVLGDKSSPAWSHDGQFLAYVALRPERDETTSPRLAVYAVATGEVREFPVGEPPCSLDTLGALRWSPDDRFVLGRGSRDDGVHFYQFEASSGRATLMAEAPGQGKDYVYSSASDVDAASAATLREAEKVRNQVQKTAPGSSEHAVSPDGKSVAYVDWEEKAGGRRIMVMHIEGGTVREVVPPTPGENIWFYQIRWTTDGRSLVYVRDLDYVTSIWSVSAQGGPARQIWVTNPRLGQLALHPDGRRVAFGSARTLQHEVWVVEGFLPKD